MTNTISKLKKAISIMLLSLVLLFVLAVLAMIISNTQDPIVAGGAMFLFWSVSFMGLTLIMLDIIPKRKHKIPNTK